MEVKGCFGKKGLERIIRSVNKSNMKKVILFRGTPDYDEKDGYSTYQCIYPDRIYVAMVDFSKSEMLYLQKKGFIFKNENKEVIDVKTLKD